MDKIRQYQKLSDIKPSYHKLNIPYHKPSIKRIEFNLKELELYYSDEKEAYETEKKKPKKGGVEIILIDDLGI